MPVEVRLREVLVRGMTFWSDRGLLEPIPAGCIVEFAAVKRRAVLVAKDRSAVQDHPWVAHRSFVPPSPASSPRKTGPRRET